MSKTIKGKEVIALIESAEAIIIMDDNQGICYVSIDGDDDEFWNVDVNYEDGEQSWEYSFKVWADDNIEINNDQMLLLEADGTYIPIKLLEVKTP